MRSSFLALATAIIAAIFFLLLLWVAASGVERQDIATCKDFRDEAADRAPYSELNPGGFYITPAEARMCKELGIDTGAVVLEEAEDLHTNTN